MDEFGFERLEVYQKALRFTGKIYKFSGSLPDSERFGIISQLRRATTSIVLNIAEGSCARSKKDFARFIGQAIGSLVEVKTGLIIAGKLNYIARENFFKVIPIIDELFFKMIKFKKTLK